MKQIAIILTLNLAVWSCDFQTTSEKSQYFSDVSEGWAYSDSIQKNILPPIIPTDSFVITNMNLDNTPDKITKAIEIVAKKGGGTLVLSEGTYNSGPIFMQNNTELFLEKGALIKFIPKPELYPLKYTWFSGRPCMNYSSLIYARNKTNIKISGKGIIDGQGNDPAWKNMKYSENVDWELLVEMEEENIKWENRIFGQGHSLRPDLIAFYNCSRINISEVKLLNTPYFAFHPVLSNNITISGSHIKTSGYDQIGIAIESSRNVLIDNMQIEDVGEGIKILSGSVPIPDNQASANIIIQNSNFRKISYTPVIFSSKSHAGINRVFIKNLNIESSGTGVCFYGQNEVKIHDIFIRNIYAENITNSFFYSRILRREKQTAPVIYNIHLDSIQTKHCGRAFMILGHSENAIRNININHSDFNVAKGSFLQHIKQFSLNHVNINGKTHTVSKNAENSKIPKINLDNPEDRILDSDDIQFSDLPNTVKTTLHKTHPYVPVNDIDRIITSSNVIYEIDLEYKTFQNLEIMIRSDGKLIRSVLEIPYDNLPQIVLTALENYLGTKPTPFLFNDIKKIDYQDFTYFEITGELEQKLFAVGITNKGEIIEKKTEKITSYFNEN